MDHEVAENRAFGGVPHGNGRVSNLGENARVELQAMFVRMHGCRVLERHAGLIRHLDVTAEDPLDGFIRQTLGELADFREIF